MSYFDPLPCERSGRLHRLLGTRRFRPYVAGGRFWQRLWIAKRKRWDEAALRRYLRESIVLELAHLASLLFLGTIAVVLAADGDWLGVIVLGALNIVANGYPILVVRYNRHRIARRLQRRSASNFETAAR